MSHRRCQLPPRSESVSATDLEDLRGDLPVSWPQPQARTNYLCDPKLSRSSSQSVHVRRLPTHQKPAAQETRSRRETWFSHLRSALPTHESAQAADAHIANTGN